MKHKNKKTLFVQTSPELHDRVSAEAKRLDMNTATFIRWLVLQHFGDLDRKDSFALVNQQDGKELINASAR